MQRYEFICPKCGKNIVIETDSMNESQIKKLHKCEGKNV